MTPEPGGEAGVKYLFSSRRIIIFFFLAWCLCALVFKRGVWPSIPARLPSIFISLKSAPDSVMIEKEEGGFGLFPPL
jgi:hypothetical protein